MMGHVWQLASHCADLRTCLRIRVEFDPAFKVDRVCGVVKQKLTIVYQEA